MPVGYIVQAAGRHGALLRQARGNHELEVRGPSARLGLLLPHTTTTTSQSPQGTPLTVRVPYLLACWLVLGCLLVSDEVRNLYLYEYVVGAERIGAALDCLLGYALPRATLGRTARGACFAARRTRCASPSPPTRRPAPHRLRLSTFCPSRCQHEGVCRARRSAPLPTRSRSRLRRRRRASARRPNHARPAGLMFPPTRPGSRGSREVSSSRRPSGAAASRPCAE